MSDEFDVSSFSDEDNFKIALKELSDKKKLEWYSQTDDAEITRIVCAYTLVRGLQKYKINLKPLLDDVVDRKLKLRVSNLRQGRQEFVNTFKNESVYNQMNVPQGQVPIQK